MSAEGGAPAPATPEHTPTPSPEKEARKQERGKAAIDQVGFLALKRRNEKETPEGETPDPVGKELKSAIFIASLKNDRIGSGLKLPGNADYGKDASKPDMIKGEKLYITVGTGADKQKVLVTDIKGEGADADTIKVAYVEDESDQDTKGETTINRLDLRDAILVSERDAILDALKDSPAEQAVVKAFLTLRDPDGGDVTIDDELRKHVEDVAEASGVLTSRIVAEYIKKAHPDESTHSEQLKKFVEHLEENPILTKEGFDGALELVGLDVDNFEQQADDLRKERDHYKQKLDADPSDTIAKSKLAEAEAKLELTNSAYELWKEAADKGEGPLDEYFEKMQKGNIKPEAAKGIIDAFKTGDIDKLIAAATPALAVTEGMSPEEKARRERAMKILKTSGKALLYTGGAGLALAAILAAIGVAISVGGTMAIASGVAKQ